MSRLFSPQLQPKTRSLPAAPRRTAPRTSAVTRSGPLVARMSAEGRDSALEQEQPVGTVKKCLAQSEDAKLFCHRSVAILKRVHTGDGVSGPPQIGSCPRAFFTCREVKENIGVDLAIDLGRQESPTPPA